MKTKKLLSLLLALMMMLSVVPMYASAATALKATNVTEWPTATGEIFYGQVVSEGITISGGKVEYNGVEVPGKFVHYKEDFRPLNASDAYKANLKFVPDDTTAYTGFNKLMSADVTYTVKKTTPVWMDENNLPTATAIVSGQSLSASSISGGTMKNPYNEGETGVQNALWQWTNPDTVVTASGEYEAYYAANEKNYEKLTRNIYVEVEQNIYETEIIEVPTIDEMAYGATWNDVVFEGGKAIVKGTNAEVSGTFKIDITNTSAIIPAGTITHSIIFMPDDTENYLPSTGTVTITVKPASIKFVDENGAETVPEITVPYGTKIGDVDNLLEKYAKEPEVISIHIKDCSETDVCATGTYTAILNPINDSNYEKTEQPFNIIVEAKKLNPTIKASSDGYYVQDSSGTYKVQGTFDVYVDGKLYKNGVKYLEKVAYVPETSGTHEIKFVYKPVENDNFAIENEIKDTFAINLVHKITASENILSGYGDFAYGTAVEISANLTAENFAGWKITDAKGNEVALDGVDNSKTTITITMPDYNIHVEALEKNATSGGSGGIFDMDFGDLSEGDSEWAIINIIRNIIAKFKSFLQQLIETFQSIGG